MAAALFFTRSLPSRLKLCRYLVGEATTRKGLPCASLERPRLMPDDGRRKDIIVPSEDAALIHNLNDLQSSEKEGFEFPNVMGIGYHTRPETGQQMFVSLLIWGYAANGLAQMNKYLKMHLHSPLYITRSPRSYLAQMIVYGVIPDLATFTIIIQSYCEHFKYHRIVDVLFTQMKAMGVEGDEFFYETLMDGVCAGFGSLAGFQLLKNLRSKNRIRIPVSCYNVILSELIRTRESNCNLSMVWLLIDVIEDMKKHGVFLEEEIYNSLAKARCHFSKMCLIQAIDTGRQIFAKGIKIGAISLDIAQRRHALKHFKKMRGKFLCKINRQPK